MKPTKTQIIGFIILTLDVIFAFVETKYFGFNMFPMTNAEIICDSIAVIVMLLSLILIKRK